MKRKVQRSDLFKSGECGDKDRVCGSGGNGGSCRSTGVTYEVMCRKSERKYIGETSRNVFTRGGENWKGIAKKSKDSPFHVCTWCGRNKSSCHLST